MHNRTLSDAYLREIFFTLSTTCHSATTPAGAV